LALARSKRAEDLLKAQLVITKFRQVGIYFILLDEPTPTNDLGDAGNHFELPRDSPNPEWCGDRAQLMPSALDPVAIDFADGGGEWREFGLDARRQIHALQNVR